MAYTAIDDGSKNFQTTLYTGNNDVQVVTNTGNSNLQPDLVWLKNRTDARWHRLLDSSRGTAKNLYSNEDDAEGTESSLTAFGSDGFTLAADSGSDGWNENSDAHVAWQWKANGGTATATGAESGNNPAYSVQANQAAGFSIVTYTGTGAEGDVTHGLGGKPDWILVKNRDESSDSNWVEWHKSVVDATADNGGYLYLNTNAQDQATSVFYEGDAISSTVVAFKGGNQNTNKDTIKYVMYCWRSIKGYSKFGGYLGNGNADGAFVYTGFKPAWLMIKMLSDDSNHWMIDSVREPVNPAGNKFFYADANNAEVASDKSLDLLSNGFKCRAATGFHNDNGARYAYMAFAEHPFVSSKGTPVTAR
jgi:hypothetical protein